MSSSILKGIHMDPIFTTITPDENIIDWSVETLGRAWKGMF